MPSPCSRSTLVPSLLVPVLLLLSVTQASAQTTLPEPPTGHNAGASPAQQAAPTTIGPAPSTLVQPATTPIPLNRRSLPAVRISTPPVIDGDISDPIWQKAAHSDRFTDVLTGQPVPDQTEVFLAYDDQYIYVAFHAYDSHPEGIVAHTLQRGVRMNGEDIFSFTIDAFRTHQFQDRSWFSLNPLGTEYAHLSGGRGTKLEWEGAWRGAARIVKDGWTGEMAIPWKILNYPAVHGPTTAGINFDRVQQRTNTHSYWSNLGEPERDELDGAWVGVQFPPFHRSLSLLPYMSPSWRNGGARLREGLDLRAAISPTMTVVGSVEPDFENVEQAVEGISFSYGERYVPDLRPFFQEGQSIYRSGGAAGQYFYTQRIPNFDTGVNVYGKLTPKDTLGALSTVSFGREADWIVRNRHEISPTLSVDSAFINRDGPNDHNRVMVLGQDYSGKFWRSNISYAGSFQEGEFKGGTVSSDIGYNTPHWFTGISPHLVQPGFTDQLGFIPFTDYEGASLYGGYFMDWHHGPLRNTNFFAKSDFENHYGGAIFRHQGGLEGGVTLRNNQEFDAGWNGGLFEQFYDNVYSLHWMSNAFDPFHSLGLGYSFGREGGAPTRLITPSAVWRFGQKLTFGLQSTFQSRQGYTQQNIVTFNYDFTRATGIVGRVVAQTGGTNGYMAFRHSGYGGTETWLILGDPNAKSFQSRIAAKVVWAL